jgi:hypothetical protein
MMIAASSTFNLSRYASRSLGLGSTGAGIVGSPRARPSLAIGERLAARGVTSREAWPDRSPPIRTQQPHSPAVERDGTTEHRDLRGPTRTAGPALVRAAASRRFAERLSQVPLVQPQAADTDRALAILSGPGDVAVEGD